MIDEKEKDWNLAPLKKEGDECCVVCWETVGKLHKEWCAFYDGKKVVGDK